MASLPKPIPGLIIRYGYLWAREHDQGRVEGLKDRPCAIVLAVEDDGDQVSVVVLPVSHSPPATGTLSIEIPHDTKRRLGLDDQQSWIVLSEANHFIWPGFDLRPAKPGDMSSIAYGELPANLFRKMRAAFVRAVHEQRIRLVPRSH